MACSFDGPMALFNEDSGVPVLDEVQLRPKSGFHYIYRFTDPEKANDWRADNYPFKQNGKVRFVNNNHDCVKFYFSVCVGKENGIKVYSSQFSKRAFISSAYPDRVLIIYEGDDSIVADLPHCNAKHEAKAGAPFIRTQPSLMARLKNMIDKPPSEVYSAMVQEAQTVRDPLQIRNARKRSLLANKKDKAQQPVTKKANTNLNVQRAIQRLVKRAINLSNHYGAEFVLLYRFPNNKNWSCGVKAIDPVVKTADGLSLKRANKFLERTSVQAVSKEWLAESTILQATQQSDVQASTPEPGASIFSPIIEMSEDMIPALETPRVDSKWLAPKSTSQNKTKQHYKPVQAPSVEILPDKNPSTKEDANPWLWSTRKSQPFPASPQRPSSPLQQSPEPSAPLLQTSSQLPAQPSAQIIVIDGQEYRLVYSDSP